MNFRGKETQIWVHQEPKLNMRIMRWEQILGYLTSELTFIISGQARTVGHLNSFNGVNPVSGSAHWDGNHLVYEQNISNPEKGYPRRIIRTCALKGDGSKVVVQEVVWLAGEDHSRTSTRYWEKRAVRRRAWAGRLFFGHHTV
jgi:hypothetical protein